MRRWPLAAWLALLSAGVVLMVAGALAPAALALFARMAEENARARAQLAAAGAAEAVEREAAGAGVTARLLAERPTLQRLAAEGDGEALAAFLARFAGTSGVDGAAVQVGDRVLAAAPAGLPWAAIGAVATLGESLHPPLAGEGAPLAVGKAPVAGRTDARTLVVVRLGPAVERRLAEQFGLGVSLHGEATPDAAPRAPGGDSYRGRAVAERGGRVWVETSLPAAEVAQAVRPLRRTFVLVTLAASVTAMAAGALAGRQAARPLAAMRRAAQRIGGGDLATPVGIAPGAELSSLSGSLDEMRQRLRSLTSELRHREAEAKALLEGIVEGVFAVDAARRIQYVNPQGAALLGIDPAQAIGRFCGDVLRAVSPGGGRPCDDSCPIVHARSRGSSRAVEHLHLPAGRRTVVITSAPPAGDSQVQLLRDETEREAAHRTRDAVLANVSHELKTPLSAQLASIELLRDGLGTLEPRQAGELVTNLERSTLRLMRLVDNLLESVRIETGKATLRRLPVELEAVVEEAAAMTRPLLAQKGQRLEVGPLDALPSVAGDAGQLTQVVVNLVANAHRYSPDGSAIRIGADAASGRVTVWVEDRGPGVPAALSSSIFDRFHRADDEGDGMGLGLWIAKSIVERHSGRIAVVPAAGGGARFTLTLPIAEGA